MSINIGYSFTRCAFFCFNVLFWIVGCGALGVGVWLYVVKTEYLQLSPSTYGVLSAAGLCIAAGATVVIIGFVGCCGAWIESKCLLITYFVFVLLVFVVESTAGVLGVLYRDEVSELVRYELYSHMRSNSSYVSDDTRGTNGQRITWDDLQQQFRCCGVDNYKDWFRHKHWPYNDFVPDSCCDPASFSSVDSMYNCGKQARPDLWFTQGCHQAFNDWILEHMHIVGVVGLLLAFVQLFGLVSSMLLYCGIREREQAYRACRVASVMGNRYRQCRHQDDEYEGGDD